MTNKQAYAGLRAKLLFKVPSGHADFKLVNPDGPEAAEAISSLLKRVGELEGALSELLGMNRMMAHEGVSPEMCDAIEARADAALIGGRSMNALKNMTRGEYFVEFLRELAKRAPSMELKEALWLAENRFTSSRSRGPAEDAALNSDAPLSIGEGDRG